MVAETLQEAPTTDAQTDSATVGQSPSDVAAKPLSDATLTSGVEGQGGNEEQAPADEDTDESASTPPDESDPQAHFEYLTKKLNESHALSDAEDAALGKYQQQARDRENARKLAEADRLKAAETKTSLRNKFIADVAGSDDNSREFIERQNLATTYIDEIMATADTHVNADRLVGFRSLLRETYKDSPAELATLDQLNGFDAHLSAVIRAAHDEGARTASEAGPMGAELKKLRDTAKKFEEIGGDGHYKKVIGDKVSERAKGVAPSSAGKESATSTLTPSSYKDRLAKGETLIPAEVDAMTAQYLTPGG